MFLESNWTWLAERWGNMADLAERVDDLICSFDSAGDTTMDTLSMLIFGWMLFGLAVLCVGKYVYNRIVLNEFAGKDGHRVFHGDGVAASGTTGSATGVARAIVADKAKSSPIVGSTGKSAGTGAGAGGVLSAVGASIGGGSSVGSSGVTSGSTGSGYVPPTPPVRKRLTRKSSGALISPARSSRALHLPTATGADAEAVRWVNELIVWLHSDLVILNELLACWVSSLNDFTAGSNDEVSLLGIAVNVAGARCRNNVECADMAGLQVMRWHH